jgi:DNA-directed RNA polymerase specialized sigma24 family protein
VTRYPGGSIVRRMDRTAAIAELPEAYATALRLRDDDVNDEAIAARLGIEVEAVEPLLRLAAAKLNHILTANDPIQD